jgi:hypothetical protein
MHVVSGLASQLRRRITMATITRAKAKAGTVLPPLPQNDKVPHFVKIDSGWYSKIKK